MAQYSANKCEQAQLVTDEIAIERNNGNHNGVFMEVKKKTNYRIQMTQAPLIKL